MDTDTHNSDKRRDCKWGEKKKKKKTSKIRLERRLLESDYTIKKMLITDVKLEGRYLP